MHALSIEEFLKIPHVISRFPNILLSTSEEIELFDKWIEAFISRLTETSTDQLIAVIKSVRRLRLVHQCRDEPIVVLAERLSQVPLENPADILEAFGSANIPPNVLDRMRGSLIRIAQSVAITDVGGLMHACMQLPVFPEMETHLFELMSTRKNFSDTNKLVIGCLGIRWSDANSKFISGIISAFKIDDGEILRRIADMRYLDREIACVLLEKILITSSLSSVDIAGYARLVTVAQGSGDQLIPLLSKNFELKTQHACVIVNALISLGATEDSLKLMHRIDPLEIQPWMVPVLIPAECPGEIVSVLEDTVIPKVKNITTASAFVAQLPESEKAIEHFKSLLESRPYSVDELIKAEKILSGDGLIYLDKLSIQSLCGSALKSVTRAIFKQVRMAPIDEKLV
jgi:hypothetical protein